MTPIVPFKTKKHPLVAEATSTLAFGVDTIHVSLGKLPNSTLAFSEEDFDSVATALARLERACRGQSRPLPLEGTLGGVGLPSLVKCDGASPRVDLVIAPEVADQGGRRLEYMLTFKHAKTGRTTVSKVILVRDQNGNHWLNVSANPTTVLLGSNVVAPEWPELSPWKQLGSLLRLPFALLKTALRVASAEFQWGEAVASRIRDLEFRVQTVQVYTYMPTAATLLSQIVATYSIPSVSRQRGKLLGTALGLKFYDRGAHEIETVLVRVMAASRGPGATRQVLSANFYDKALKSEKDAAQGKIEVGAEGVMEFLRSHTRADITLSAPALKQLMREASLDPKDLTARNFRNAVVRLDAGKGKSRMRFMQWLLTYVLVDRMKLPVLLRYSPKLVDRARRRVENVAPAALAAFDQWREQGFKHVTEHKPTSFVSFASKYAGKKAIVSAKQARRARLACLDLGLDLDVPLDVYNQYYAMTFTWAMTEKERGGYCRDLEAAIANDKRAKIAVLKAQERSRQRSVQMAKGVRRQLPEWIGEAHVPSVELRGVEALPRLPKPRTVGQR